MFGIPRAIWKMRRFVFDAPGMRQFEGLESVGLFLGDGLENIREDAPRKMGAQVAEAWAQLNSATSSATASEDDDQRTRLKL